MKVNTHRVVTVAGNALHTVHEDEETANAVAQRANADAERLDIVNRYRAEPIPADEIAADEDLVDA